MEVTRGGVEGWRSGRVKGWRSDHRDDDDAGLGDDVLLQLVEGGVGVVGEAPQLLHHVVQVEEGPQGLQAAGAVDGGGVEAQQRVVLLHPLLDKLRRTERLKQTGGGQRTDRQAPPHLRCRAVL